MAADIYSRDLKTPEDIAEYNEAEISRVFADTIGNLSSKAGIFLRRIGDSPYRPSFLLGIPYNFLTVHVEKFPCDDNGNSRYDLVKVLVVGPYAKDSEKLFVPKDVEDKTVKIPLKDIVDFKRIELADLLE